MNALYDDESQVTIPNVTRHDNLKTMVYMIVGISIAFALIAGTVWLFVTG
ncbi:MAG: hypothetical protein ACFE0Q_03395 [Anaerolineae bacterium]